jgi:Holliday junction DNA helicase RuvA
MIGYVKGTLVEKGLAEVTIDVQGIGYSIQVPMSTLFQLPELNVSVKLFTHLSIREDAHVLFGFHSLQDRRLFRQLIKVNGVGPKMGLAILSGMDSSDLIRVVQQNDLASLVKVPGVGKKTAERLLIELRDKLKDDNPQSTGMSLLPSEPVANSRQDAESALVALGYKPAVATQMVQRVYQSDLTSDMIIRNALKSMVSK